MSFKHHLPVIALIVLILSCKGKSDTHVPKDIIPPDSMAVLLTDVHMLQASLQLGYTRNDSAISSTEAFNDLWKKHHMTAADYNRYVNYYSRNPTLLDTVYERVLNNLSQQKAELMGTKPDKK